uniref:Ig-like domain-containing protein n=1 Tax=Paramormyrops kingsleyae TaxID=1676925 RepID=A0A3B3Q4L4_9TELE
MYFQHHQYSLLGLLVPSVSWNRDARADKVNQSTLIISPEGDKAVLTCSHDITRFNSMYWYVQHPNKAPEPLIHGYDVVLPKGRFSMEVNRTERLTNLSISDSRTEDTAVYYCAVEPTVTQSVCLMLQKHSYSFSENQQTAGAHQRHSFFS